MCMWGISFPREKEKRQIVSGISSFVYLREGEYCVVRCIWKRRENPKRVALQSKGDVD